MPGYRALVLIAAFLPVAAPAQGREGLPPLGRIAGQVVDSASGKPIGVGDSIHLEDHPPCGGGHGPGGGGCNYVLMRGVIGAEGRFTFESVPTALEERLYFVPKISGYRPLLFERAEVRFDSAGKAEVRVRMRPEAPTILVPRSPRAGRSSGRQGQISREASAFSRTDGGWRDAAGRRLPGIAPARP